MLGPSIGVLEGSYYGLNLDCVTKAHVDSRLALPRDGGTFKKCHSLAEVLGHWGLAWRWIVHRQPRSLSFLLSSISSL